MTQNEFDTITTELASAYDYKSDDAYGVVIGVRLPYGRIYSRIVCTAPTQAQALSIAKQAKNKYTKQLDLATCIYMPEYYVAKSMPHKFPKM